MWKRIISGLCSAAIVLQGAIVFPESVSAITIQEDTTSEESDYTVTIRTESKMASPNETVECKVYLENSPGFKNYSVTLQYDNRLHVSANGEKSYSLDAYDLI